MRPAEGTAVVVTARSTLPGFIEVTEYLDPVGCVVRGFRARYRALCCPCGRDKMRSRHVTQRRRLKKQFNLVLVQLLTVQTPT